MSHAGYNSPSRPTREGLNFLSPAFVEAVRRGDETLAAVRHQAEMVAQYNSVAWDEWAQFEGGRRVANFRALAERRFQWQYASFFEIWEINEAIAYKVAGRKWLS